MLLVIRTTADNERGPRYTEQVLANLHRYSFTLLILPINGTASIAIQCKDKHYPAIARELHAAYPNLSIDRLPDSLVGSGGQRRWTRHLSLYPHWFSLRTYQSFWQDNDRTFTDPVASLLMAIAPRDSLSVHGTISLRVQPVSLLRRWLFARKCERKPGDAEKATHQLYKCRLTIGVSASRRDGRLARRRLAEIKAAFGQYTSGTPADFYSHRMLLPRFMLSDAELATIWHPTLFTVRVETMQTNDSPELEAPKNISSGKEEGSALLGTLAFRGNRKPFGIKSEDRRRHLYITGKTGMGKSTLLQKLIASDMIAGRGVGLIDPHGDLAEDVLRVVPKRRTGDVVLIDAGDRNFPAAYDPLRCGQGGDPSLTASAVVTAFKKLYGDSWGPRLEHILRNAVLALLDVPETSFLSLMRMLTDKSYRERLIDQVRDPLVRSFWLDEFANKPRRFQEEAIAPIQNKVGQFLSSPLLRAIVGQVPGRVDFRKIIDDEKILIVNLSKGRTGEDASTLLGALLVTSLQQAAMSRAELAENDRRDFYLYVDEFQNFATESFATILSEARKYRLNLTVANQYLDQMDEGTRHAIFGNVGSLLCFQVGTTDAEILAEQLAGDVQPRDLITLEKYHAYCRLLIDGMPSKPFSMQTLPPIRPPKQDRTDVIRRTSRRRYSRPVRQVLDQLAVV